MINFDNTKIKFIALHFVGNKTLDNGIYYSEKLVSLEDEDLINIVKRYFFSSFSNDEMYCFHNDIGLEQNEIYTIANRIFKNPDDFFSQSKLVALHLYNSSTHPKIKKGELYVSFFHNVLVDDKITDAIGFFKSENKENYLKTDVKNQMLKYEEGTNIKQMDKGCLIFNIEENNGYKVCIVDSNKSNDTQYWKENFLNIRPASDNYHFTKDFLSITKNFVTNQLINDFEVSKAEQIDLLNRSVDYFKKRESFDKQEFEKEVFADSNIIDSFRKFDQTYREENEVDLSDNFEISAQAVKKQARVFKSVLKLDKNFHIYIHGDKELIEQGVDENGRKFYKIYYDEES